MDAALVVVDAVGPTAMIAVAALLLKLNFGHPANRAFAILLCARAAANLLFLAADLGASGDLVTRLFPYFQLPLFPATAAFALRWPRMRGAFGRHALILAFAVPAVFLDGIYALDHAAFNGILEVIPALWEPAYAGLALLLVREAARTPSPLLHRCFLLVGIGFSAVPATDMPLSFLDALMAAQVTPALLVLGALTLPLLAAAVAGLAGLARSSGPGRRAARGGLALLAAAGIAGIFAGLSSEIPFFHAVNGGSRVVLPLLVGYALLRLQLFDIDLKVKWSINRGTLAAVFLATFLVVSQLVQNLTGSQFGPFVGALAAGLLLFALTPLQRFAERVADTALPNAKAPGQLSRDERARVYREAVEVAWDDGVLDKGERRLLDQLRDSLALSADDAQRLEREALAY